MKQSKSDEALLDCTKKNDDGSFYDMKKIRHSE